MRRAFRRLRHVCVAVLLGAILAGRLAAQGGGWSFRTSATADLWFHGLAVTRFTGFGAQPLYRPSYPAEVRGARDRADRAPTRLEQEADLFRDAFLADSAFEVLHFVPLYFVLADPDEMLAALERVARDGAKDVGELSPRVRFGAATVAAVLAAPPQRAMLGRFVSALREEWPVYRAERAAATARRTDQLGAAMRTWQAEVAPAVTDFLHRQRLDAGVVLAVPALGVEGRLFAGDPGDRGDNIVAVGLDPTGDGQAAAWLALKELAFPAAREVLGAAGRLPPDRVQAERLTGNAAVRAGGLLLEPGPAGAAERYRTALERAADCTGGFEACFALPAEAQAALAAGLR